MEKLKCITVVLIFVGGFAFTASAAQSPLVELGFANSDLTNTGTVTEDGYLTANAGGAPSFVPGVAPGSTAFDNTIINPTYTEGLAVGQVNGAFSQALNGAQSFTISMWLNIPEGYPGLGNNASTWQRRENSAAFHYNINSFTDGYGRPRNYVNGQLDGHPPYAYWNYTNQWFFAAVTYDSVAGTTTTYRAALGGTNLNPVVRTYAVSPGPLNASGYGMIFGPRDCFAYLDNIRVYASQTDSSGALSHEDLLALYNADQVAEIPEPASIMLLSMGIAGVFRKIRT